MATDTLDFARCPVCGSSSIMRLPDDWQEQGKAIPIVACGNLWHYATRSLGDAPADLYEIRWGEETYWTGAVVAGRQQAYAVQAEIAKRLPGIEVDVVKIKVDTGTVPELAKRAISTWADDYCAFEIEDYAPRELAELDGEAWDAAVEKWREAVYA